MIDSHCHLDLEIFAKDLPDVIASAQNAGVTKFMIPGIDPEHWHKQIHIRSANACVDIAFGYHPFFLPKDIDASSIPHMLDKLTQMVETHAPQAIGEIGIDRSLETDLVLQEMVFTQQLELAQDMQLPIIVHHRKSHDRLIGLLKQSRFSQGGIIHAFSGNASIAKEYVDLGFKLGVGGTITYPRGAKTLSSLLTVGLANLVLETDAPDMPMHGRQGQRNSPEYINDVVSVLAEAFDDSKENIIEQTTDNYNALFAASRLTDK